MDVLRLATWVPRSCGRVGWSAVALASLLPAMGCGLPAASPIASSQQPLGEPMNGSPTPDERLGIMALNRARSSPSTIKGPSSASYPARPPVQLSYPLSRSSRFHATNLSLGDVTLMHSSPCTLNTNVATANCDGTPSCACSGGTIANACKMCANVMPIANGCGTVSGNGTDTFTRIGYFTAGTTVSASGEIAAAGYPDPIAVVDGWMNEPAGNDGHRQNILDQGLTSNVMGYGRVTGSNCFSSFDVSDSGDDSAFAAVNLPTAAVSPSKGSAGSYAFYATWADSGGAPMSIDVVVDGQCTAMTKELGTDTLNATYKIAMSLSAGCHTYRVVAKNAAGVRQAYPTTGTLTVAVGAACPADWQASAVSAPCDPVGGLGDMAPGLGDGGSDDGLGSSADLTGGLIVFDLAGQGPSADQGCALISRGAPAPAAPAVALMLAGLIGFARRRRGAR